MLTAIVSCKKESRSVESIDFSTDYKFSSEIEGKIKTDSVPWKHQLAASDYAIKGDYKNALIQWDLAMGTRKKSFSLNQIDSINNKYFKVDAVNYIVKQAKKNRVVIINEAHHNSSHRKFTKSLLQKLFDNGYKKLGLEALSNGNNIDNFLNSRKYPLQETGHYIKDPQFGNLVRTALEIGYTVFPYEQTTNSNGKLREIEQAKNIQSVIANNPNEKFLIHCGFDHVLEGKHNTWEKAMAGRLTEYTDINPLTINQVIYSEKSKPEFNHPLLKAFDINTPSIFVDKDNRPLKYERGDAWTDIAVFHPNTKYSNGRPDWLFENGNKKAIVKLNDIEIDFPVMVLAYKKGEDFNLAVPVDITEVKERNGYANLALKKGNYNIVVTNRKNTVKFERSIK